MPVSPLQPVNLLVGRNATGKSRTVKAIQNVANFLKMKGNFMTNSFAAVLEFGSHTDSSWKMIYSFKVDSNVVTKESLVVNGQTLIKRSAETARYQSMIINPPSAKLIVQVRRDKELYPEIELLMTWAEGVTCVSCSDINAFTIVGPNFINPFSFSDLVDMLRPEDMKKVLDIALSLGYRISSLKTISFENLKLVQIKEKGVAKHMVDIQLSSGMLRTLYLLCFIMIIKHNDRPSLLLIDDLGEGLDYRRSTDLGKLVFEYCKSNGLQLIASSNDSFLMDVVDLADWQVLRRTGGKVSAINYSSHPDLFKRFKMTGLSNFDFFSSDFIDNNLVSE